MKPAARRTISLLLSLGVLVLAVIVHVLFVRPVYSEVVELRSTLKAKSEFYQDQGQAITRVNDLIAQYQGVGQLQQTVSMSFPVSEDLSAIFNQLRTLAEVNNLSIKIFGVKPLALQSLSERNLVKNVGTLQLSLKVLGSYESFKGFLRGIETNIRVMDTQQITVEQMGKPGTNFYSYTLLINTYYQGEE